MKTLFLHPPSFDGFDGGAGARYQAKREITSYWFPTWLAQPAAMVPGSKLMDAAPHHQTMEDVLAVANNYELFILHTSTPSLLNDVACADALHKSLSVLRQPRDFDIVQQCGALLVSGGHHVDEQPGVVELSVVIDRAAAQAFGLQCWQMFERLFF